MNINEIVKTIDDQIVNCTEINEINSVLRKIAYQFPDKESAYVVERLSNISFISKRNNLNEHQDNNNSYEFNGYSDKEWGSFIQVAEITSNRLLRCEIFYYIGITRYNLNTTNEFVKNSITDFLSLSDELYSKTNSFRSIKENVTKASELAMLFGKKAAEYKSCCDHIINKFTSDEYLKYSNDPVIPLDLIDILYSILSFDTGSFSYVEYLDEIIKMIISKMDESWFYYNVKKAFELKFVLLNKLNKTEEAKHSKLEHACVLCDFTDKFIVEPQRKIPMYEEALKYCRQSGDSNKEKEIQSIIENIQLNNPANFQTFSHTIDITKIINTYIDIYSNKNVEESIILYGLLTHLDTKEYYEKQTIEETEDFFTSLFPTKLVDSYGRTIKALSPLNRDNPKENIDLFNEHLYRSVNESLTFYGQINFKCLCIINDSHKVEAEDFNFLVDNNIFISEDRREIIKLALYYGFNNKSLEFLTLICPQIEYFFREIVSLCGGNVTRYNSDLSEQNYITLGSVLDNSELNECYDESVLLVLRTLLNAKTGANIRNNVSHGLLGSNEAKNSLTYYLLGLLIKILSWYSPNCINITYRLVSEIKEYEKKSKSVA
jgi:hypothetical protein